MSDQWDAPIGTAEERASAPLWPGYWIDATPYGTRYLNGATGTVRHVVQLPVWGNVIVIVHSFGGATLYTRYGHVEAMSVKPGQMVQRGDPICKVGNGLGAFPYHLHYDIAKADLGANPGHWPGDRPELVKQWYLDPLLFTREHHTASAGPVASTWRAVILAQPRLRVRQEPSTSAAIIGYVAFGTPVIILSERDGWGSIAEPAGWIDLKWTARKEVTP